MQTFREVLNSATDTLGYSCPEVTGLLSQFKTMGAKPTVLMSTIQMRKQIVGLKAVSDTSDALYECLDQFFDSLEQVGSGSNSYFQDKDDTTIDILERLLQILGLDIHEGGESDTQIRPSQYHGDSPIFHFVDNSLESRETRAHFYDYSIYIGSAEKARWCIDWDGSGTIHVRVEPVGQMSPDDQANMIQSVLDGDALIPLSHQPDPEIDEAVYWATLNQLLDSTEASTTSFQIMAELIDASYTNSTIPATRVFDIVDHYPENPVADAIRQSCAGCAELSKQSILALLGKVFQLALGTHDDGAVSSYTPLSTASIINNIIGTVVTFVATIVILVLTIVFHAIAAIISVVISLLSVVLSKVFDILPKSKVTFDHFGDIPNYNCVGHPKTWYYNTFKAAFAPQDDHTITEQMWRELYGKVKERGLVYLPMQVDSTYGSSCDSTIGVLIFPGTVEFTIIMQPILVANATRPFTPDVYGSSVAIAPPWSSNPNVANREYGTWVFDSSSQNVWTISKMSDSVNRDQAVNFEYADPSVMAQSDADQLLNIFTQIAYSSIGAYGRYAGANTSDPTRFQTIRNVSLSMGSNPLVVTPNSSEWASPLLGYYEAALRAVNARWPDLPDNQAEVIAYEVWRVMLRAWNNDLDYNPGYLKKPGVNNTLTWEDLNTWFVNHGSLLITSILSGQLFDYHTWYTFYRSDGISYEDWLREVWDDCFVFGGPCMDPSFSLPTITKNSVISAVAITAITSLVVTGTVIALKVRARKKAPARLALREKQFSEATEAYQNNPTPENAKRLYKSNKKLTKAWKRAKRSGLQMYNGFDTGASSSIEEAREKAAGLFDEDGVVNNAISSQSYTGQNELGEYLHAAIGFNSSL